MKIVMNNVEWKDAVIMWVRKKFAPKNLGVIDYPQVVRNADTGEIDITLRDV